VGWKLGSLYREDNQYYIEDRMKFSKKQSQSPRRWPLQLLVALLLSCSCRQPADAFTLTTNGARRASSSLGSSAFCNRRVVTRDVSASSRQAPQQSRSSASSKSQLNMFLGQDSGVLGVGAPEIVTIVLVGYFVLGPSELYKLTKEIGKFITNIRTLGQEATSSFEGAMENQLAIGEIRKAQEELSDAFNFRRSINVEDKLVDEPASAVSTLEREPMVDTLQGGVGGASAVIKKKRRKKRKPAAQPVEDLDMSTGEFEKVTSSIINEPFTKASAPGYDANIEETDLDNTFDDQDDVWERRMKELDEKENVFDKAVGPSTVSPSLGTDEEAMSRFQSQLSVNWNDQIVEKTEELEPLGRVMEQLALLEDQREAAISRIEEEFRRKEETEQEFYTRKRLLLEEAAAQIQAEAYSDMPSASDIEAEAEAADANGKTITDETDVVKAKAEKEDSKKDDEAKAEKEDSKKDDEANEEKETIKIELKGTQA
jgi:Sec-independent protein translocase protein TatA